MNAYQLLELLRIPTIQSPSGIMLNKRIGTLLEFQH